MIVANSDSETPLIAPHPCRSERLLRGQYVGEEHINPSLSNQTALFGRGERILLVGSVLEIPQIAPHPCKWEQFLHGRRLMEKEEVAIAPSEADNQILDVRRPVFENGGYC